MKARNFWKKQGENFMTPNILGYYETPDLLIELSHGRGIFNPNIYGVSVATKDGERDHTRSQCFQTLKEANSYIRSL